MPDYEADADSTEYIKTLFDKHGFVVVRGFFPDAEITKLRAELEKHYSEVTSEPGNT